MGGAVLVSWREAASPCTGGAAGAAKRAFDRKLGTEGGLSHEYRDKSARRPDSGSFDHWSGRGHWRGCARQSGVAPMATSSLRYFAWKNSAHHWRITRSGSGIGGGIFPTGLEHFDLGAQ